MSIQTVNSENKTTEIMNVIIVSNVRGLTSKKAARLCNVNSDNAAIRLDRIISADKCNALQSQKAESAYFTSKQILPFGFARRCTPGSVYVILSII